MTVNFDNLRRKLANKYNALCHQIQELENPEERQDLLFHMMDWHDIVATFLCLESEAEGFKSIDDIELENTSDEL